MGRMPPVRALADGTRILGVNIAAGDACMVLLEVPDRPLVDETVELKPAAHLDGADAARDFHDRFLQELRRVRAEAVAVAHTRQASWVYSKAVPRVRAETCIMLACTEQRIPFFSVGQEAASKAVGVPLKTMQADIAGKFGITPGKRWKDRHLALAAAVAAAQGMVR
jgi:hypothetical protein